MGFYEDRILQLCDDRIRTLARIRIRSFGADVLSLTAMRVMVYSQLEGGVKELVSFVIRQINSYPLQLGEISPALLKWRNSQDINSFRAAVNFDNIASSFPFGNLPAKRVKVRPINRISEFNQMNSQNLTVIYDGLRLNKGVLTTKKSNVDDLVSARNDAAHHGVMPTTAKNFLEAQLRDDATMVEKMLEDLALQFLTFFSSQLFRR